MAVESSNPPRARPATIRNRVPCSSRSRADASASGSTSCAVVGLAGRRVGRDTHGRRRRGRDLAGRRPGERRGRRGAQGAEPRSSVPAWDACIVGLANCGSCTSWDHPRRAGRRCRRRAQPSPPSPTSSSTWPEPCHAGPGVPASVSSSSRTRCTPAPRRMSVTSPGGIIDRSCGPSGCEVNWLTSQRHEVDGDVRSFTAYAEERGWGDGLPLVPPTGGWPASTSRPSGRYPDELIAKLPPLDGEATVEKIAVKRGDGRRADRVDAAAHRGRRGRGPRTLQPGRRSTPPRARPRPVSW